MKKTSNRSKRAISPVIATVILIAVAVAIGLAVSFWASGLTGTLTKYEKLEMRTAYASVNGTGWTVYLQVYNTGSTDATITSLNINGKPISTYGANVNMLPASGLPISLITGSNKNIDVNILSTAGFISGQTIEVALTTASGTNYPKAIVLS